MQLYEVRAPDLSPPPASVFSLRVHRIGCQIGCQFLRGSDPLLDSRRLHFLRAGRETYVYRLDEDSAALAISISSRLKRLPSGSMAIINARRSSGMSHLPARQHVAVHVTPSAFWYVKMSAPKRDTGPPVSPTVLWLPGPPDVSLAIGLCPSVPSRTGLQSSTSRYRSWRLGT